MLYQLGVIQRSIEELHRYLRRKVTEVREVEQLAKGSETYNHRQLALLSDATRHPERHYTFQSHATGHNVTTQTARNDLLDLSGRGLLDRRRIGRRFVFTPHPALTEQLKQTA